MGVRSVSARPSGRAILATLVIPATVGVALLVSPQVRALAAYLNGHVLLAALLLGLLVLLGSVNGAAQRVALPAVAALTAAVVFSRGEGALLVGLLLLGTLATRSGSARAPWRGAWVILGLVTFVWTAFLITGLRAMGSDVPRAIQLLAAIGILALLVAGLLGVLPQRPRRLVLVTVAVILWAAVLVLLRLDTVRFLDVARANIGQGDGGWGTFGPLLIIAGLIAVALTGRSTDTMTSAARWFAVGFIPLLVLVGLSDGLQRSSAEWEQLLQGGGRTGWGESVNRMWTHGVLIVAALLVLAGRAAQQNGGSDRPRTGTASPAVRAVASAAIVAMAGGWLALQWQPTHLPKLAVVETVDTLNVWGETPVGELVDGASVRQATLLTPPAIPDEARLSAVCVGIPFVTYARTNTGSVDVELEVAGLRSVETIEAAAIIDWTAQDLCQELTPSAAAALTDPALADLTVTVRGVGAGPGSAVSVLQAPSSGFGAVAALPDADGSSVERRIDHLVMDVTFVTEAPVPLARQVADRTALLLPWLLVVLGVAAVLASGASRGRWRQDR